MTNNSYAEVKDKVEKKTVSDLSSLVTLKTNLHKLNDMNWYRCQSDMTFKSHITLETSSERLVSGL